MIGPVMIGPSSSHTAGACRIGLVARQLLGQSSAAQSSATQPSATQSPTRARIGLHASFAKTGRGHGTHLALVAGLLGFQPDDARLPEAFAEAQAAGLEHEFQGTDLGDVHPNSACIELEGVELEGAAGNRVRLIASSTGGGVIEAVRVDGFRVSFSGASATLLIRYTDALGVIAKVASLVAADHVNVAALVCSREKRGGAAMLCIEMDGPLSAQSCSSTQAEGGVGAFMICSRVGLTPSSRRESGHPRRRWWPRRP